jgi:hypothetical protein
VSFNLQTSFKELGRWRPNRYAFAAGLLTVLIFSENLFGRRLNALFMLLPGIDKILHGLEYAIVFACFYRLAAQRFAPRPRTALIALAAGLVLAVTDEVVQGWFPGRNVEWADGIANCAGLTMGWAISARTHLLRAVPAFLAGLIALGIVTHRSHVRLRDYATALRYERQHEFILAREYYQRALRAGMRSPTLYNELAWVEVESGVGTGAAAVAYAIQAVAAQPGNADFLDTYGWALYAAGRPSEALEVLKRAYEKSPEMYCIHYHLGATYLALGQRTSAEAHLRRQIGKPNTREAALASRMLTAMGIGATPDPTIHRR